MRHARSTQLIPDDFQGVDRNLASDFRGFTLGDLREWHRLGGKCSACLREGWLDKYEIQQTRGSVALLPLQPLLRCRRCNNKGDNKFIVGMMARD